MTRSILVVGLLPAYSFSGDSKGVCNHCSRRFIFQSSVIYLGKQRRDVQVVCQLESTRVSNCHSQGCTGNKHTRLAQAQQGQPANWTATGAATQLTCRRRRHEVLIGTITLVFCCKLIHHKCATQIFSP